MSCSFTGLLPCQWQKDFLLPGAPIGRGGHSEKSSIDPHGGVCHSVQFDQQVAGRVRANVPVACAVWDRGAKPVH